MANISKTFSRRDVLLGAGKGALIALTGTLLAVSGCNLRVENPLTRSGFQRGGSFRFRVGDAVYDHKVEKYSVVTSIDKNGVVILKPSLGGYNA